MYRIAAVQKNISIVHDFPGDLPPITADKGQISVILHNLISNAIKYTLPGNQIKIWYSQTEGMVILRILDGGEGITEEKIKEIEKIDTQMESLPGTEMETGTGIGLALVKHFLELNNGKLTILSYPGKGSEFFITLPAAKL